MKAGMTQKSNTELGRTRLQSIGHELYKNRILFFMLLPMVLYTFIFSYIPMGGIVIAFKNFNYRLGILGSKWVGLDNFAYLFKSGTMSLLIKNTLFYNLCFIFIGTAFKVVMAILLSEMVGRRIVKAMQSVMLLPYFISWVIIGGFVYNMLNYEYGIINNILTSLGFNALDVYNNPGAWRFILIIVYLWQESGYGMIYYLTAITGIDTELYEASALDGASLFQRIRYITLPMITPTIIILLLMSLSGILSGNFQMFYQLIGSNTVLFKTTDIIETYSFRALMVDNDYGYSAATGLFQQAVGFIMVMTVNAIVRRYEEDYALF